MLGLEKTAVYSSDISDCPLFGKGEGDLPISIVSYMRMVETYCLVSRITLRNKPFRALERS